MLREPQEGIDKMPISFYQLKVKEIQDLQKKLVSVDIRIIEEKEKSSRISLRLSEDLEAEIQVSNHVLKKQQDDSYKMSEGFYQSKFKEVVDSRYSQEKQKMYEKVAVKNGFDVSKRSPYRG